MAEVEMKFVAVINRTIEMQRALNALGHIVAGLAGNTEQREDMGFVTYKDGDGSEYPNISKHPFIVLKGNGSKIKQFRMDLIQKGVPYACFLDTMIHGGNDVQVEETRKKKAAELEILAIATFGRRDVLDPLTKKFSVWTAKAEDVA